MAQHSVDGLVSKLKGTPTRQMNLAVLGSTGLKQHSGFVDEEFLIRLRGRNGIIAEGPHCRALHVLGCACQVQLVQRTFGQ